MTEDEGFLRRWSRRKRQVAPQVVEAVPEALPPEEMPPPAETIPLEEIAAWMGRRVPEGWREAALRRVWSADVAIRDFVGPADYAWDWNVPGGAPGWGPMRAIDDIAQLLSRAIGEPLPAPPAQPEPEPAPVIAVAEIPPRPAPLPELPPVALPEPAPEQSARPRRGGRALPV